MNPEDITEEQSRFAGLVDRLSAKVISSTITGVTCIPSPQVVHEIAKAHGWYEGVDTEHPDWFPAKMALVMTEGAEAIEAYRRPEPLWEALTGEGSVSEELADMVIRIFDICAARNIDIAEAIWNKVQYNKARDWRHGGKRV